jgi:hypothetical protein
LHVLRCSFYTPPITPGGSLPTTVVVRDVDVTVTPEEWVAMMEADAAPIFVATEVFESPDTELPFAIKAGMERLRDGRVEAERNMAIAYYWFTQQLARMKPGGGIVTQTRPAPFGMEDAKTVLRQIKAHPSWREQGVTIITDDGEGVGLRSDGNLAEGGHLR